jgi:hypothetical protein
MSRKSIHWICVAALLSMSGLTQAGVFTDNFDTVRDYLVDGVAGTGWDGFLGRGPDETVNALNASTARPGALYIESANSFWEGAFSPRGPFLYKVVEGDFVATVRVTDFPGLPGSVSARTEHTDSFLMARAANLDDAGAGEDFVCVHYFPTWSGNLRRSIDNGTEDEGPGTADGYNCARYIQLERVGNIFYFRRSLDGVTWTEVPSSPVTRDDLDGLALQVGLAHCMYSANTGYVAFDDFSVSGSGVVPPNKAFNPRPAGGAMDVPRNVVLSWTPSEVAASHDLYFGTVLADVAAADRVNPLDLALGVGQDANSYDVGRLELGQMYCWRVDEVEADGLTIHRGEVWSFTVEPHSYPIRNVVATASSINNATMGPEKTVDGSGLDADDQHSTTPADMWLSKRNDPQPTWIQFAFDRVYKVDRMLVWNSNQALESALGIGAKDVAIQYSADGSTWTDLREVELAQAPGEPTLTPETVDLGGVVAKYVKLNITSNWANLLAQYGLSEVRFFSLPVSAREPKPASGATGVNPQTTLSWRAGREAASHEVVLNTDEQAVAAGTAPAVTVAEPRYEAPLDLAQSYFWKVVEVNDAEVPAAWESDVWNFSTAEYLVIDDFEGYDDLDNRVYQTWIDGWDNPASNGAVVGYSDAPFAERTVVNGGRQSMPLAYDNASGAVYSEAKRTFATAQDWTQHGITALVIYFQGKSDNGPAPLYVKINDTKVLYNNGAAATTFPLWKQWSINLAATGANLQSVKSLTIGLGDGTSGGKGDLFIDDIRLYRSPPQIVVPTDPGSGAIVANYTMNGNLQDSSGRNNHGTLMGDSSYDTGVVGQALLFNGTNAYVDLPIGSVISTLSDMTISMYANFSNTGGDWQRIFDFGTGTTNYMFLSPRTGTTGPMRFAIRTATVTERVVNATVTLPSGWHHVAVVIDSATMTLGLYLDGQQVGTAATTLLPKDLGNTTQNWLGRSQFEADAYFTGALDEFRIYNRALSEGEVRYLAGDR